MRGAGGAWLNAFTFGFPDRELAKSDHAFIHSLRAHHVELYWAEGTRIERANTAGQNHAVITEASEIVNELAVDDTDVYFATDAGLYRVPN